MTVNDPFQIVLVEAKDKQNGFCSEVCYVSVPFVAYICM